MSEAIEWLKRKFVNKSGILVKPSNITLYITGYITAKFDDSRRKVTGFPVNF